MQTWLIWSLISFLHPNSYIPLLWIRQVRLSIFLSTLSHFSSRTTTVASPEALLWLSSCEPGSLKWQHWCCEPESRRRDGKLLPLKRKPGSLLETVPIACCSCFTGLLCLTASRASSLELASLFFFLLFMAGCHLVPLAIAAAWEPNLWPMEHSTLQWLLSCHYYILKTLCDRILWHLF